MRGRKLRGAVVVLGVGAGLLAGPAAVMPAKAECLYVVAYVTWQGKPPTYAHNGCVTGTPWRQDVTANPWYTGTGHPNGTPNGFFVDARVPLP